MPRPLSSAGRMRRPYRFRVMEAAKVGLLHDARNPVARSGAGIGGMDQQNMLYPASRALWSSAMGASPEATRAHCLSRRRGGGGVPAGQARAAFPRAMAPGD